jgi:hypothetical protein
MDMFIRDSAFAQTALPGVVSARPRKARLSVAGLAAILVGVMASLPCAAQTSRPAQAPVVTPDGRYTGLPAFPGAEGFGMYATGGRGGSVYEVTTLDDYNPRGGTPIRGSLRDAVSQGNRTVVFGVSGTIALKAQLNVTASNITIAGQTAPGDGICLRDYPFGVSGHNIIVRYLRSRLGDVSHQQEDSLDLFHGASNVIFDHCSATWAVDECFSTSGNDSNFTIQWCLIGQALNDSFHKKGPHGYGSLARANGNGSWIYNLWADNVERNPRLGDNYGRGGRPNFEMRNNVIYNYGRVASGLTQGWLTVNYLDNYIRPGPVSNRKATAIHTPGPQDIHAQPCEMTYYLSGNVFEGHDDATKDNAKFFDHTSVPGRLTVHFAQAPVVRAPPPAKRLSAEESYKLILDTVGATLPVRDRADADIIQQVRDRTGSLIDSQTQAGGWPVLKSATPPVCSLHDGIPDAWKTAHGLDIHDPGLGARIGPSGYTYLEEYLNGTDPQLKVDYLDPKNNVSSLKPGSTQALWVPTPAEAAAVAAVQAKYQKMGETSTYPAAPQ